MVESAQSQPVKLLKMLENLRKKNSTTGCLVFMGHVEHL